VRRPRAALASRQTPLKGTTMDSRIRKTLPEVSEEDRLEHAPFACGVWMRAGVVGACAAVIGLSRLVDGHWNPLSALGWIVAGVALTAFSWGRVRTILRGVEGATWNPAAPAATVGPRATLGTQA
jgi:hypothetical protein